MSKAVHRGSRAAPITIDGDEPVVKREAEEEADSPLVAELKMKLEKKDRLAQGAIAQAGTYRERVLFLEGLIDEKNDFIKKKQTTEDLEKKIEELQSKLAEYEEGAQSIQQLQQKAIQAEKREEDLKKRVLDLMNQLKEESRRMNEERKRGLEDRMRDQERFEALTAKLEELEQQLSVQQVQQQEKENIPEQPEELQPNEDARSEVEVEASLEKNQNDDGKLEVAKETKKANEPEKNVDELCEELIEIVDNNPDGDQWRHVVKIIHRMFSKDEKYAIDVMIKGGLVPFFVEGLYRDEAIQLVCATAIAKIVRSCYEEESEVVKSDAAAPLIELMTSTNYELAEEATNAVSAIVGESAELRDAIIGFNGAEGLATLCDRLKDLPISFVRVISGTFENMCCHVASQVSLGVLEMLMHGMLQLLQFEDREVCKYALVTMVAITSTKEFPQEMLVRDSGILPLVFKNLNYDDDDLVADALKALLNMTTSRDESMIQSVLDLGTLSVLPEIMKKKKENSEIIRACCKLIVNVTAGSKDRKQSLINNGLLKMINKVLLTGNSESQYPCSWALYNLVMEGTRAQILSLMAEKPMAALAAVLTNTIDNCVGQALIVIHKLLSNAYPSQLDTLKKEAEEAGVIEKLEKLKKHSNEKVRRLTNKILSEYFAEKYGKEANENLKEKENEEETKMVQKRKRVSDDANSDGVKKGKSDEKRKD